MKATLKLRKTSNTMVDESEIDQYRFSYIAVRLVLWYNESLLEPVKKIGNLPSGAYGVFRTNENEKILPTNVKESIQLMTGNSVDDQYVAMIPTVVLRQVFPNINVVRNDTIRVNVSRAIAESNNDFEAVKEIASTIVHEATHVKEWEDIGSTGEAGPQSAERMFQIWVNVHEQEILNAYPALMEGHGGDYSFDYNNYNYDNNSVNNTWDYNRN